MIGFGSNYGKRNKDATINNDVIWRSNVTDSVSRYNNIWFGHGTVLGPIS